MDAKKKELAAKLDNNRQITFCHEYILDWNGARAARIAGYAPKSARIQASALLTKPNIRAYIEHIKDMVAENVGISKAGLLNTLKAIAGVNISDIYLDWVTMEEFQELKDLYPEVMEAIQEISTKTEQRREEGVMVDVKYVRIKLYDKRLAIQDIFKAMGWNAPDKIESTVTVIEGIEYLEPKK